MDDNGILVNCLYYSYIFVWILSGFVCTSVFLNRLGFSVRSKLLKQGKKICGVDKNCPQSIEIEYSTEKIPQLEAKMTGYIKREFFPTAYSADCMKKMYK